MTIAFIGDIHKKWDCVERGLAALERLPDAAVLLGDIECTRPLDDAAAPLLDRGIPVFWIYGNHDDDGGEPMWANLVDPARNPRTAAGALHGRVVNVAGVRVAGIGGTFRTRVWEPPHPARLHRRSELQAELARMPPAWRSGHVAELMMSLAATAVWPEDYDALAAQRADILVTHEAPGSHAGGNAALDALARAIGARLIVHGHHHVTYRAVASDGLHVAGVAAAWGVDCNGKVLWCGEEPRRLLPPPQGWSLEGDAAIR